jgi:PKD repeat protein
VNLATTAPGSYTVTNTVISNGCTVEATWPITITALPAASISYAASTFCTTAAPQSVIRTPGSGVFGSYTATPAGLTIDGSNDLGDPSSVAGQITPSTSTPGTYTVKYTFTDGFCSNTVTTIVTISAPVNLTVAAASSTVCTVT